MSRIIYIIWQKQLIQKNLFNIALYIAALYVSIYLFNDNLATGGSLAGAILSCHVELSKYSTS